MSGGGGAKIGGGHKTLPSHLNTSKERTAMISFRPHKPPHCMVESAWSFFTSLLDLSIFIMGSGVCVLGRMGQRNVLSQIDDVHIHFISRIPFLP